MRPLHFPALPQLGVPSAPANHANTDRIKAPSRRHSAEPWQRNFGGAIELQRHVVLSALQNAEFRGRGPGLSAEMPHTDVRYAWAGIPPNEHISQSPTLSS